MFAGQKPPTVLSSMDVSASHAPTLLYVLSGISGCRCRDAGFFGLGLVLGFNLRAILAFVEGFLSSL